MAQRSQGEAPSNAQPGAMLLAVHEFAARSPDEISLTKGDRVELIEKDDDFGDGWYLGKHIPTGSTGLFPEVYTIIAPTIPLAPAVGRLPQRSPQTLPTHPGPTPSNDAVRKQSPSLAAASAAATATAITPSQTATREGPYQAAQQAAAGQRSPHQSSVMSEMHNVINEHMTDLHKSQHLEPSNPTQDVRPSSTGSDSHYGQDYIPGEETDEEEDAVGNDTLTEDNVKAWSPDEVSAYLLGVGVEQSHCDLFREEEFTGEVLLEMEQQQVFLKELDLGPIGRRMKTWQKIKALQDEVRFGSVPMGYASSNRTGSPASLPHSPQIPKGGRRTSAFTPMASSTNRQTPAKHQPSIEQAVVGAQPPISQGSQEASHVKQPSFDRGWSMQDQANVIGSSLRPASTTHLDAFSSGNTPYTSTTASSQASLGVTDRADTDRGYTSGGENENRRPRKLSRKRQTSGDQHKRMSSFGSESRRSSKVFFWQKKRDSRDDTKMNDESSTQRGSRRDSVRVVSEPIHAQESPTVTNLEYDEDQKQPSHIARQSAPYGNNASPAAAQRLSTISDTGQPPASRRGNRTISEAVTGKERALLADSDGQTRPEDSNDSNTVQSPGAITASPGSSTTFAEANQSEYATPYQGVATSGTRRKPKRQTSAYTRGLLNIGPREQAVGADYSGWMKKKSLNLMTNWKPRYFVLKGRRLSYYYSENDTEEKGLIDITNHRVLPADKDFFTGLHATLTRGNTPSSGNVPTNTTSIGSSPYQSIIAGLSNGSSGTDDNQGFIFKLVPPRSGLSKGVNFTKPAVHYFSVSSRSEGRLWMAALMKSTIDRDESQQVVTTYSSKTISLEAARARRELPPFLKGVEEEQAESGIQEDGTQGSGRDLDGGNIGQGEDSMSSVSKPETTSRGPSVSTEATSTPPPGSFASPTLQQVQREGPADLPRVLNSLESNGVIQPRQQATQAVQDDKGLGIQGLNSGISNEPSSPILDRVQQVGMS